MATIEEVIAGQGSSLMEKLPGVIIGVGQTEVNGERCILLLLTRSSEEIKAVIPSTLGGYTVVTEVSPPLKAQRNGATPQSG